MAEATKDSKAADTGPVQRYRFKVRTADGREMTSAIASVKLPAPLQAPMWSDADLDPGEKVALSLKAPGRDGETVHFLIERRGDKGWETIGHAQGKVASGAVKVDYEAPHLPADVDGDGISDVQYADDAGGDESAPSPDEPAEGGGEAAGGEGGGGA